MILPYYIVPYPFLHFLVEHQVHNNHSSSWSLSKLTIVHMKKQQNWKFWKKENTFRMLKVLIATYSMLGWRAQVVGWHPSDQFLERTVGHSPPIQWKHVICLVLRGAFGNNLAIIEDIYNTNLTILPKNWSSFIKQPLPTNLFLYYFLRCSWYVDMNHVLRYVGVTWFFLHVLCLLPIRCRQQSLCCIDNSMMKHMQKPDRKSNLPLFSYGYRKCMFVDFFIWIHNSSQLCSMLSRK